MMLYSHKKTDVVNILAISHTLSFLLFFQHSSSNFVDHTSQSEGHKPMVLGKLQQELGIQLHILLSSSQCELNEAGNEAGN